MSIADCISPELGRSQQPTGAIDYRPDVGIPMRVHPTDHNLAIGSTFRGRTEALLLHVYNYVVRSAGQELFRRYVVGVFLDVPHVGRHE